MGKSVAYETGIENCPGRIKKDIKAEEWAVFSRCVKRLTSQHIDLLFEELFDFVSESEPNQKNTELCNLHPELLPVAKAFSKAYNFIMSYHRDMLPSYDDGDLLILENAIVDLAVALIDEKMKEMLPGLDTHFITALSAEKYERHDARKNVIALLPSEDVPTTHEDSVIFEAEHTRFEFVMENRHALRKELNMCKKIQKNGKNNIWHYALAAVKFDAGLRSVGLVPDKLAKKFPRIVLSGHMSWEVVMPRKGGDLCFFRYVDGSLAFPEVTSLEGEFRRLFRERFGRDIEKIACIANDALNTRGAVIIFAEPEVIKEEVERLANMEERGISVRKIDLSKRGPDFLRTLTSIDGALMVDTDGLCYAAGVILDGIANSATGQEKGSVARGARFNSTKTYILQLRRKHICAGLVVSEDGMFDFF